METTPKVQSQVISSAIKKGVQENTTGQKSTLQLTQPSGGRPLSITIGGNHDNSQKHLLLTVNDMSNLQSNLNLTDRATNEIAAAIRVATRNRKAVETGLKTKLAAQSDAINQYFGYDEISFMNVKANKFSEDLKVVVYCKDVPGFIEHVKEVREVSESLLKIGIDGGGGFLKICLSVQSTENAKPETKRSRYEDGIASKRFKDSGEKKLFLLAISSGSQENYENVAKLWTMLNIHAFDGTIATDLKLANILVGIMAHSSSHPCTWCFAKKDELNKCGTYRTVGNTMDNYKKWCDAGAQKQRAKNFNNCINPPLFHTDSDKTFLELIPPPELHLMLGVVNTIFGCMLKQFENESLAWAKACHVQREVTHNGPAFKGNSCKALLNKVDILRRTSNLGILKYVKAFDDFRKVVDACFGTELDRNFKNFITAFELSYKDLDINITPKVHAVIFHVTDFCEKNQVGLATYSEQAMEAVHHDFKNMWGKNKVSNSHPDYAKKLLRAVCKYNSLHL